MGRKGGETRVSGKGYPSSRTHETFSGRPVRREAGFHNNQSEGSRSGEEGERGSAIKPSEEKRLRAFVLYRICSRKKLAVFNLKS